MAIGQPPPTWADVTIINDISGKPQFHPVWLKWFLDLQVQVDTIATTTGLPTSGGTMSGDIDMGGNNITNMADAVGAQDATTLSQVQALIAASGGLVHGQCQLSTDSLNVYLSRYKGQGGLIIDGTMEQVPVSPVTADVANCFVNGVAAQTLADATTYLVFAFMNAGTMTLDFRTTLTYADDEGVIIRTGDSTRTLVGMVRATDIAGTIFVINTLGLRHIRTWFNDPGIGGNAGPTASGLTWAREAVFAGAIGVADVDALMQQDLTFTAIDAGTIPGSSAVPGLMSTATTQTLSLTCVLGEEMGSSVGCFEVTSVVTLTGGGTVLDERANYKLGGSGN